MELGARQVAEFLNISEKQLYQWISRKKIPAIRVGTQYRFNKAKLIEWAISRKITLSPAIFAQDEPDFPDAPRLDQTLEQGGVHYGIKGSDIPSVLEQVIALMPLPPEVDRGYVLQVLLARESMGSTGLGNGIAIPHVRNPIIMRVSQPVVSLCFLETPIPFNAIDGKPVHTLFTIVSPSSRAHIHLLSRLSYALKNAEFMDLIGRKADKDAIVASAGAIENALLRPDGKPANERGDLP
jgi:PTS system nitrogen regulatory IIA component